MKNKIDIKTFQVSALNIALLAVLGSFSADIMAQTTSCADIPGINNTFTNTINNNTALSNNDCVNTSAINRSGVTVNNVGTSITTTPNQLYVVTTGKGASGIQTQLSGTLALHNIDIYTNDNSAFGIISQSSSSITSDGIIKIDTTGGGRTTRGVDAESASSMQLKDINIYTSGDGSYAIAVNTGGSISTAGIVNIDTSKGSGANTYGAYATDANSIITLSGGDSAAITSSNNIVTGGQASYGLYALSGGVINVTGAASATPNVFTTQINTTDAGNPNSTDTIGVNAGSGGTINFTNGGSVSIKTGGDRSYGVQAADDKKNSSGGSVSFSGAVDIDTTASGIATIGVNADGGGSTVNFNGAGVSIKTAGTGSYGVQAKGYGAGNGASVKFEHDVDINTLSAPGQQTYGAYANGAGAVITFAGGDTAATGFSNVVDTGGDSSYGLYATGGGVINITGASSQVAGVFTTEIDTSEADSGQISKDTIGVYAKDAGSQINFANKTLISTSGDMSYGIYALNGAKVINTDLTKIQSLGTQGNNKIGIFASGANSIISLADADITTRGQGSSGIKTDTGGAVRIQGVATVDTAGAGSDTYGLHATGAGSSINLGGGNSLSANQIITGGDRSFAVYADDGAVINIANDTIVDTSGSGTNTIGVYTEGGGAEINFTNAGSVKIKTGGTGSFGVKASDVNKSGLGSRVSFSGAVDIDTLTAPGDRTYGAIADGAGSVITFAGGDTASTSTTNVIDTGGQGSYGLYAANAGVINVTGASSSVANIFTTEIDTSEADIGGMSDNSIGIYAKGSGSQINLKNNTIVLTSGDMSYGIYALAGASVTNSALTKIESTGTTGNQKIGVYASGASSNISLGDTTIITRGVGSSGIRADATGSVTVNGYADIDTAGDGDNTFGVHATDIGSLITLNGAEITTGGNNSHGLVAENGGTIIINGAIKVETSGDGAAGVLIDDSLAISHIALNPNTSGSITTTGNYAHGLALIDDYSTSAELLGNLTINTFGVGSDALNIDPDQLAIITNITNSTFTAQQGNGITLSGGNRTINLDSTSISSTNGLAIDALTSPVNGAGTQLNLNLKNTSFLNGAIWQDANSTVNLNIDSSSIWRPNQDSTVQQLVNSGTIILGGVGAKPSTNLTILGDYIGNNGLISLNASQGDDSSLSDFILIKGSTYGTSRLMVNDVDGSGAQTVNGIKIIEVNGASDGMFTLQGRAVAGAYEYFLYQGTPSSADGNWYLRSEHNGTKDVIRPEVGGYLANQNSANAMFAHSLHQRVSEGRYANDASSSNPDNGRVWARVNGYQQNSQAGAGQLDIRSDSSMLQVGADLIKWHGDNSSLQAGLMFGAGQSNSVSRSKPTGMRTDSSINGYALGMYATWYAASNQRGEGAYADSWLQYGHFDNHIKGELLNAEKYSSHNWQASIEAGYAIALSQSKNNTWYVEPQAQIIYSNYQQNNSQEYNGTTIGDANNNGWSSRLGSRFYANLNLANGMKAKPFVELNWLHKQNAAGVTLSTEDSSDTINSQQPKDRGELKVGAEAELTKNWNVWADLGYQQGGSGYSQTAGNIGVKYRW